MNRLLKFLKKYNTCFIPCFADAAGDSSRLLRNIRAMGYDCVKVSAHSKASLKSEEYLVVLSGTNQKDSHQRLSQNMLEICKQNGISSIVCFKAGNKEGSIFYTEETKDRDTSLYFETEDGLCISINEEIFVVNSVSDVIDHAIRTASMFKQYGE